jgi:hypothetical protein
MAITPEDALEVTGFKAVDLESYESAEDFKKAYEQKFIARSAITEDGDLMKELAGRINGPYESAIRKTIKESGIEIDNKDLNGLQIPEIFKAVVDKGFVPLREQLAAFQESGSGGGDEVMKKELGKWKEKAEKFNSQATEYKELHTKLTDELEQVKSGFENEKKSIKIETQVSDIFGKIKFKTGGLSPEATDMIKKGFQNEVKSNFKFDLDDAGKLVILSSDGKKVTDKKESGKILEPFDAVKNFAVDNKIWEDNPHSGKTTRVVTTQSAQSDAPQRKVHPLAARG